MFKSLGPQIHTHTQSRRRAIVSFENIVRTKKWQHGVQLQRPLSGSGVEIEIALEAVEQSAEWSLRLMVGTG